jgi:hypothetical protein
MRRLLLGVLPFAALALAAGTAPACGSSDNTDNPGNDGGSSGTSGSSGCTGFDCNNGDGGKPGCVGLECSQTTCDDPTVKTTLTGTVFDPAGKVPVFNAIVYVPRDADPQLADITDGASCDRCDGAVTGNPIVITSTDTSGNFTLADVPVTSNLPIVIQIGKWRRVVKVPTVTKCTTAAIDPTLTRLPRNSTEGHIPRIAVTTGAADPLQCLLRKIGLDDSEFGIAGSAARVHLYKGGGFKAGATPTLASSKLDNNTAYPAADSFWADEAQLKTYDVVLLGCEGDENNVDTAASASCPECATGATKTDAAKTALYDYAKAGGRVFASHYHYVWFSKNPDAAVKGVATWVPEPQPPPGTLNSTIGKFETDADMSTAFPKVVAMKDWLSKQNALTADGKLHIVDPRYNASGVSASGLDWIHTTDANVTGSPTAVQQVTFNTPVGAADKDVCGRVVFSDLHVASGAQGGVQDDPQGSFPSECKTTDLSPQQKALEFMLFDLSSCVQNDQGTIVPPH